jgi:hypothetical protein
VKDERRKKYVRELAKKVDEGKIPFRADEDVMPYIFISYAHKDSKRVYPIIKQIHDIGFNIWYDQGISGGKDWRETIETHIENCTVFLLFLSTTSIKSPNVKNEIAIAEELQQADKLGILPVHLEELKDLSGFKLTLSRIQYINEYEYKEEEFYERITSELTKIMKDVQEKAENADNDGKVKKGNQSYLG